MTGSRYQAIADELRRRITDGELVPGARVPSTRQVAAEWGVAMATATKALGVLREEGLVRTEPRSGTVVAGPAPARERRVARARQHDLTRERIVGAAIEIADTEGLAAVSMRGVAARLGVAPMTPYQHVAGKGQLVMLMADVVFGERGYPRVPPSGWRARVELGARTLWSIHRRHPWLAQISPLSRPLLLPNLMVHAEWILSALAELGLSTTAMFDLNVLLYSHVQGIASNLEREQHAVGASGLSDDEWMDNQAPALAALAESGQFPTFAKTLAVFATTGYDLDLDHLFEHGLRLLLDGLARH
jgi:DNA-binding transcriptional regulator YhcF (GntR family)